MGKNKKKDPSKKLALQAKKDAKADKAARKRAKKDARTDTGEILDDLPPEGASLDDLLQAYRKRDIQGSKPIVETLEGFPAPRGNFSMTVNEDNQKGGKQEVFIFGGEYFNGVETLVVDHLFKWTFNASKASASEQHEWKQILMPVTAPSPPARCAHSAVYYNNALYVFGGELATTDHYHHYKDLWKYDITQQSWSELTAKVGSVPSARSGHSAVVWKHYMVVFGGFYEAMKDTPRWFNDVFVFNLKTEQWMDIPYSKLGNRPEPRSACNVGVVNDKMILQGGFSKLPNSAMAGGKETKVHTDGWSLNLKPILQDKPPTWEKLLSSAASSAAAQQQLLQAANNQSRNPNGRSACASATYKNKLLVFGGVIDAELMHHKVDSVFFPDLFCLEVEPRPKWYPLKVARKPAQAAAAAGASAEEDEKEEESDDDDDDMIIEENEEEDTAPQPSGWNIDKLRENMFAFTDGAGNLVYERIAESKANTISDDEEEKEETKEEEESDEEEEETKSGDKQQSKKKGPAEENSKPITSSSVMVLDPTTNTPQAVQRDEPLPRIKCGAIVNKNTLFIYGGLVEIGDREVTLDDMWSLDLKKRSQWKCLFPGTMHQQVWVGAVHDDDDSYISTGDGNEDDSDDDDEDNMEEAITEVDPEVAELSEKYDLNNSLCTPQKGEALADFYSRTKSYWNEQATEVLKAAGETEEPTNKELKREGFQLARKRFDELEPIMERLKGLTLGGDKGDEKKKKEKSKKKKKN